MATRRLPQIKLNLIKYLDLPVDSASDFQKLAYLGKTSHCFAEASGVDLAVGRFRNPSANLGWADARSPVDVRTR